MFIKADFASAYLVENLKFQNEGDIVIGPGKTELWMAPGDSYTKEILISNRSGQKKIFKISVEDFKASKDPTLPIEFMGNEKSPYSLKDYVKPEIEEIVLSHGQRLRLPVAILIPQSAAPGGLYGAVMVSAENIEQPTEVERGAAGTKMKIITRVASLFFIRVKGEMKEEGVLKDFTASRNFYEKGPAIFRILSENTGNVHLSPYGYIEVKNILGSKVGEAQIDPWFVMPKSERTREIKWNSKFLLGRYTAEVFLNRGYKDIIDQKAVSFWVIPWKILLIVLIALILVVWAVIWLVSHLEFKRKPKF